MRIIQSWLQEFTPVDQSADVLASTMSNLGLAVESVEEVGRGLDAVVVARVVATRAHPDADRIQLVDVDAGDGEATQIACGAFNMGPGDLVPLAPVGATLPGGMEIGRRKMRGEWSNGMLCSAAELGLGADHGGILVLGGDHTVGTSLIEALGITEDVVYDLEITPNRPDAMSHAGVARDLAAKLGLPFHIPEPAQLPSGERGAADLVAVEIGAPDLCGRFVAAVLEGVRVVESPPLVATRLRLAGMRPINSLVDASNYVMLELGQPTHPYDHAGLPGPGLGVRLAREGETLVTLDAEERTFLGDELLITDGSGDPVGIAGVMGGSSTEISADTTTVVLEAAWFSPIPISRTSRRLKLRSEASARFEKGADPEGIGRAVDRFCELVGATSPEATRAPDDVVATGVLPDAPSPVVRTARVNAILGTDLDTARVDEILAPIGFRSEPGSDPDTLVVHIPSWRADSRTEIDVIEEVGRLHGFDNLEPTALRHGLVGSLTSRQKGRRRVRRTLAALGIDEALNSTLLAPADLERAEVSTDAVALANPMISEESVMRTSLRPHLLRNIAYNASHRNPGARLFEAGTVFAPPDPAARDDGRGDGTSSLPSEAEHLAVALAAADGADAKVLLDRLGASIGVALAVRNERRPGLHPTRSGTVLLDGDPVGEVGEVAPEVTTAFGIEERVAWVEVDLGRLLDGAITDRVYQPVSRYPSSDIDLAFEVDDAVPADAVGVILSGAGGDLLRRVVLFDVYRGDPVPAGRRSLAYRLRFQATDRTLTDDEVRRARQSCIDAVESELAATLRG